MKLRNATLIRWLAFVTACLIRAWLATLHYKIVYLGGFAHPTSPRRERFLYAIWHEAFLAPAFVRTKIYTLISQHSDGEYIAQVCSFLRFGVVRGSTTRGGGPALLGLTRMAKRSHLLVTPDGPRGPRRRVQPGLVYLSSRTGLPIVFIAVGFSRAWRARSWDRFAVPWPGSTICAVLSEAVSVPENLDRAGQELVRRQLEEEFARLSACAESWAAGGPRPAIPKRSMALTMKCA